jgi:peptidyl-tRNA hydrolase, PTH1 family
MSFVIVGLGNPGEDYENTRHNVGWLALDKFAKDFDIDNWHESVKNKGEVADGKVDRDKVTLLKPHTMMNGSGKSVATLVKSKKSAENLIVLHDDLDLPLGTFKIVYDRGAGGHRGVKSVQRSLGTTAFVRIKIGVSPATPSGKVRKPKGDQKVLDFIIGPFKKPELVKTKKVFKDVSGAIESIIMNGRQLAQTDWN